MNVLFLTIGGLADLDENALYPDLLRCFRDNGHSIYIVCQREKRTGLPTQMQTEFGMQVLRVQTGNITKTGLLEKGISTLLIGPQFKRAINSHFSGIKFNLILYSTPPITFAGPIRYIKKRDKASTYLMLKDIFPQNALDIGLLSKSGHKGLIYRYFTNQEKRLYLISDFIGCMSPANVQFLINNNPYIDPGKIEVCPNTIDPIEKDGTDKDIVRAKYSLPQDKTLFIYGGNFGKPQDVDYIIEGIKSNANFTDRHFIMCGSGTEFFKIENYAKISGCTNVTVVNGLDKQEYGHLINACDVGLIFLDHRFTIPNFPSRILDYMNYSIPVLASTDPNTDLGKIIVDGNFGWWCESNDSEGFREVIDKTIAMPKEELRRMGANGREYLETNYTTNRAFEIIVKHFN